jgi:hypothetical protein
MNTRYKIALATLAGIGIGAAAIHELHAQAKPPAYVVVAVRSIKDADPFKAGVIDKASPAVLAAAGGLTWSVPKQSEASMGPRRSASSCLPSTAWRRR